MFRKQISIKPVLFFLFGLQINGQFIYSNYTSRSIHLGSPVQAISGEHVSVDFYTAAESVEKAKNDLQAILHNFLENLQRNLSTSPILSTVIAIAPKGIEFKLGKLNDLADYFQHSSEIAGDFAQKAEHFFQKSKNESHSLLLKLRKVPIAQRFLTSKVKMQLTDYFTEMEFFHIMFSEITDQALEYIVETLRTIQRIFLNYADIQRDIFRTWNLNLDEWCFNTYMDFLQQWSAQIFKCSTGRNLQVAYDVYGTTETATKYIMRQLEFRIQRLFNCFIFGHYEIRCQFLCKPEQDFEKLFAKLDELQQYFDIKVKSGRVTINRFRRSDYSDKCIPHGFPLIQMVDSLKTCFHFPVAN